MQSPYRFPDHYPHRFFSPPINHRPPPPRPRFSSVLHSLRSDFCFARKAPQAIIGLNRYSSRQNQFYSRAFDEDFSVSSLDGWSDNENSAGYMLSSSGEDSDAEIVLAPVNDIDLPTTTVSNNEALTVTANRLVMLGREHQKRGIKHGIFITLALIIFLLVLLLYIDWCAWRIVRLPLAPFYLTHPFILSALLVACAGYVCVPIFRALKIHRVARKEGPHRHSIKKRTATMGGLFFIPIGVTVARVVAGFSSIEVTGAAIAALLFAAIGLINDILSLIKNQSSGLSASAKIFLEIAVGTWFSFWLDTSSISSPYGMKMLIPLPVGLLCLGQLCYQWLTTFCFIAMGNGVNLTDDLDGLAAGTAALAFIGMSIAVIPICSELAIFGASMAGACVGFLLHNRYKASIYMGCTGSLAIGGSLAAMASCTGMFFPMFISSGIFILEASSVFLQGSYFKICERLPGGERRIFPVLPFLYQLGLCGINEPIIVAGAYIISTLLSLLAGYVGLISA